MSYEPTVWKDGDLVTSAKLNKIEQGIMGNSQILIINGEFQNDSLVLDKTWKEITDSTFAILKYNDGAAPDSFVFCPLDNYYSVNNTYYVSFYNMSENYRMIFATDNINGYPVPYESNVAM